METNDLIQKWLSGELSNKEAEAFETLDDATFNKSIIEDAARFRASHISEMPDFDTFKQERLAPKEEDTAPAETPVKTLNWMRPMLKVASVLVIGLGIYYFFLFNRMTEVRTMVAEKTTIELPDASKVTLNAASEVRYNAGNWDNKREIKLDGEAYFDVAKGARFDVVTERGTISVLGTEFNVKNRGSFFEVACYEGTVRVVTADHVEILRVGDNFKLYGNEALNGRHTQEMPLWTHNMSDFQRIPVSEVFAELERQYGVTLTAENIDTDQLFTGGFPHNDLENALKAITEPLGLQYRIIKPDQVRLSIRE